MEGITEPSVIIVGSVRHISERGAFLVPPIHEQPQKKCPPSIGLKSYKAFQATLCK